MADGSISAEHVKMAAPQPSLVTGVVRSLGGACPALTFVLGNVTVRTSGRTVFEGGACGDLKDGMRAGAIGSRAADGGIDAERVKMAPPPTPAVTGAIASLSGTCPDVTFLIERTTIHVSAKTVFVGGTCADLKAGIKARATGPKRADGSLDAEKVEIPRQ
jgi:hypothetical protein